MSQRDIIREGFKDFICRLAKSDGADACESCEKLGLKPVCSIRHNADEYLSYLHSQGVVLKVERELPDNEVWHKVEREFEAYCAGKNEMLQWHKDSFESLVEE